jgi:hypothetical protein
LVFTPDQNTSCYKLNASNPGQFYFNVFHVGNEGDTATFTITLPYPFVTQGANPVHAYPGVELSDDCEGGLGFIPVGDSLDVTVTPALPVTLANYVSQAFGTTHELTATVTIPSSGFVYLNIHLDYGLKITKGYGKGANDDAVTCGISTVILPNCQLYTFSVTSEDGTTLTSSDTVQSINSFKKNPGVGGTGCSASTFNPVANAAVKLLNAKKQPLASGLTDGDGWYGLLYKHTGKEAQFYVTFTPPGGQTQTVPVTLKANAFFQVDFKTQ